MFVSDMFNLYKYENMLYMMTLSGKEIKDYLEMSYFMWTNRMKSLDDHLLWFKEKRREGAEDRASFQNYSFNFDSASGIIYTVDVTKPQGEKVTIASMADGSPFLMNKVYKVALNSYRGNGGGELLTKAPDSTGEIERPYYFLYGQGPSLLSDELYREERDNGPEGVEPVEIYS